MTVAILHGESDPTWKSAPLEKDAAVICGPGGATVRVKVVLNVPTDAVTVAAPVAAPAVTLTCARPSGPVSALVPDRVIGPEKEKTTVWLALDPLATFTCTTSGFANAVFTSAVCPS